MTTHTEPVNTDTCYKIGIITRTHGTRGELSINFTDDVWDRADADYIFLMVDGILVPFFLEEWRFRSDSGRLRQDEESQQSKGHKPIFFHLHGAAETRDFSHERSRTSPPFNNK